MNEITLLLTTQNIWHRSSMNLSCTTRIKNIKNVTRWRDSRSAKSI